MATTEKPSATSLPARRPSNARNGIEADDVEYMRKKQIEEKVIAQKIEEQRQRDAIGTMLGSNFYTTDKSWPFLKGRLGYQYMVTRFYPNLKVAVDIFEDKTQFHEEIEFKKKALKEHGILYGVMDWSMKLADLIPQIGLPKAA